MKYVTKLKWERNGIAEVVEGECCACHKLCKVMSVDTSGDEYGAMSICKECIDKLFKADEYCFRCQSYHPKQQPCLLPR